MRLWLAGGIISPLKKWRIGLGGDKKELHEEYSSKNKLWYMDSPYHPSTLSGGKEASYEDTFFIKDVSKMTEIIRNDKTEEYGEIDYFIKSDYDPKDTFAFATKEIQRYTLEKKMLEDAGVVVKKKKINEESEEEEKTKEERRLELIYNYLEVLEKQRENITNSQKFMGKEYIWFKGMKSDYTEKVDNDILDALEEMKNR